MALLERVAALLRANLNDLIDKAELAVEKKDDSLARAALERAMSYKELAENFQQQVGDQKTEVETLKNSLHSLEGKLLEARAKSDLLIARHRRARASKRASEARSGAEGSAGATFDRMKDRVLHAEAVSQAWAEVSGEDVEGRLAALEKEMEIDRLLEEIKSRKLLEA